MFHYTTSLRSRSRFFRRTMVIALGTGLVVIAGLSFSGTLVASNDDARVRGCTLATLKGQFLFADAGTLLPPFVPEPTLSAYAGFHVFNGDGTGTDVITGRAGGQIVLDNVVSPISYSVNKRLYGQLDRDRWPNLRSLHRNRRRVHRHHRNRPWIIRREHLAAGVAQVERHT